MKFSPQNFQHKIFTIMTRPRSKRLATTNENIEAAIKAFKNKEFPSERATAVHFKVHPATLNRRLNGGKSVAESREPYQLLSIPEETVLVQWITQLTKCGHPIRYSFLREVAQEILTRRHT